jgi:hypothetical protein
LGWSVAGVGDLDGDGFDDLGAGGPNSGGGLGKAWLYLGDSAAALTPQALHPSTTTPISPGLRSTSTTSFDISAVGRSPLGRTNVKLAVEAKPLGTPFDNTGLVESTAWTDSGLTGTTLQDTVDGLVPGTGYHWRARILYDPVDSPPQLGSHWLWGGRSGEPLGAHVVTGCDADTDGDGACDSTDEDDDGDGDPDTTDCDDTDASVFTGAPEIPDDAIDQDCNGFDTVTCFIDGDGDTFGDTATLLASDGDCLDAGESAVDTDCDDGDPNDYPGATETIANGDDEDCDGQEICYVNADGDGYRLNTTVNSTDADCNDAGEALSTLQTLDCDDTDPTVFPGATEVCNAIDDDCDTTVDEGFDVDSDGFTSCAGDCDDTDPTIFPGAPELCDGLDNDCDTMVPADEADVDVDASRICAGDCDDGDPAVNPSATEVCNAIDDDCDTTIDEGFDLDADGYTSCAGDCDDSNPAINPAATEVCNAVDDDCDTTIDDGFDLDGDGQTTCAGDCDDGAPTIYVGAAESCDSVDSNCDGDLVDGFGNFDGDGLPDCVDPDDDDDGDPDASDCADTDASIYTGAPEATGDGIDQDCNGFDTIECFVDGDGDTFGDVSTLLAADGDCTDSGESTVDTDCDDGDPAAYPDAPEITGDGVDQDCNGFDTVDCFIDGDGDSFGDASTLQADDGDCLDPGESTVDTDCDDGEPAVYPGAPEITGDGIDQDCNGFDTVSCFVDGDGDTFGGPSTVLAADGDCTDSGEAAADTDCDDAEPATWPGAPEYCDDVDSDCDGDRVDD